MSMLILPKLVAIWLFCCMSYGVYWHHKNEFPLQGSLVVNTLVGGIAGLLAGVAAAFLFAACIATVWATFFWWTL